MLELLNIIGIMKLDEVLWSVLDAVLGEGPASCGYRRSSEGSGEVVLLSRLIRCRFVDSSARSTVTLFCMCLLGFCRRRPPDLPAPRCKEGVLLVCFYLSCAIVALPLFPAAEGQQHDQQDAISAADSEYMIGMLLVYCPPHSFCVNTSFIASTATNRLQFMNVRWLRYGTDVDLSKIVPN